LTHRIVAALAVITACLVAAASAPAAPKISVFATGIDNPRGLDLGSDGTLYVASAGHAGPTCADKKKQNCFGLTSRIWAISPAGAKHTLAKGMLSGGAADGTFEAGIDDVSVGPDGRIFTVSGSGTQKDISSAPKTFGAVAGKLIEVTSGIPNPLAAIDVFEWTHNSDGVKGDRNSNPYGVLALAGREIVADAGANALLNVDANGFVSLLAVIPQVGKNQPVPTSLALGPDGAVYVGELALGAGKGKARVVKVPLDGTPQSVYADGFSTITGLDFGPDGSLYVTELSTKPARLEPPGAIVRIRPGGARTTLKRSSLLFPAGAAVAPDGTLYVSNASVLPAKTPKKSPFKGLGGQILKITGF
jgi:sugar lactone lactonase YvrE